jgi:hypothetical protein
MHDHKSQFLLAAVTVRVLHIDPAEDTLAPPTAGGLLRRMARFFQ